mmetsp:Transcript_24277/g.86703  ORF Transcript_24277/g.86703 Transcript_24277/m.86703 type:complete len:237 (-) Transcript_24277:454-1164(-)
MRRCRRGRSKSRYRRGSPVARRSTSASSSSRATWASSRTTSSRAAASAASIFVRRARARAAFRRRPKLWTRGAESRPLCAPRGPGHKSSSSAATTTACSARRKSARLANPWTASSGTPSRSAAHAGAAAPRLPSTPSRQGSPATVINASTSSAVLNRASSSESSSPMAVQSRSAIPHSESPGRRGRPGSPTTSASARATTHSTRAAVKTWSGERTGEVCSKVAAIWLSCTALRWAY